MLALVDYSMTGSNDLLPRTPALLAAAVTLLFLSFTVTGVSASGRCPYELSYGKDAFTTGGGLLAAGAALFSEDTVRPLTLDEINALDRNDVNSLDRSATSNWSETASSASDVALYAVLISPVALLGPEETRAHFGTTAVMYIETILWAAAIPSLGKGLFERTRPFVYNSKAPLAEKTDEDARRSFFSRHTTLAFSSAVFLASVYSSHYPRSPRAKYVWCGALAAASLVGYLRYESGAHYPTDIIAGAVVGSAVGYLVPNMHKKSSVRPILGTIGITPTLGVGFTYEF